MDKEKLDEGLNKMFILHEIFRSCKKFVFEIGITFRGRFHLQ